jgi:hypothetical protein
MYFYIVSNSFGLFNEAWLSSSRSITLFVSRNNCKILESVGIEQLIAKGNCDPNLFYIYCERLENKVVVFDFDQIDRFTR